MFNLRHQIETGCINEEPNCQLTLDIIQVPLIILNLEVTNWLFLNCQPKCKNNRVTTALNASVSAQMPRKAKGTDLEASKWKPLISARYCKRKKIRFI